MAHRIEWLNFAKGASIFLVVAFHASMALEAHGLVHDGYWLVNNAFSYVRMPLFFLISGFLAKGVLGKSWKRLLTRKVLFLFHVFAVWNTIHVLVGVATPQGGDVQGFLTSFVSPSGVLWFVWALGLYFVVAKAGRLIGPALALGLAACGALLAHGGVLAFENYVCGNLFEFLPLLLFGAWYASRLIEVIGRHHVPIALAAACAVLFALVYQGQPPPALKGPAVFALCGLGLLVGLSWAALACRSRALAAAPLFIGRNTLPIYVAHAPILAGLTWVAARGDGLPLIELLAVPTLAVAAVVLWLGLKAVVLRLGGWWLYDSPLSRRSGPAWASQPA